MKNKLITVGIVGGAGYTAGELIRILLQHPQVSIQFVYSTSQAGQSLYSVHRNLVGETEMKFTNTLSNVDVLFLCLGHGLSAAFLEKQTLNTHTKIIDLSNDFRLAASHQNRKFVYGLPEIFRNDICKAHHIANPGCFATAIQLGLLPLAQQQLLKEEIHVHAITGSTGAGRECSDTTHFSYRSNNISVYKAFTHQHLDEVKQTLTQVQQGKDIIINFIPVRGGFTRGIFATLYTKCNLPKEEMLALYKNYYLSHPFTHIAEQEISMKEVVNTNKCILRIEKHKDYVLITSIIDNLLKGASGQAVQNMNLLFGLEETMGLHFKSIVF